MSENYFTETIAHVCEGARLQGMVMVLTGKDTSFRMNVVDAPSPTAALTSSDYVLGGVHYCPYCGKHKTTILGEVRDNG